MNPFVVYQIKVAVFLVAFYLLYRVLMRRETFYRLNRILLIGILVASFVLPQCVVTIHSSVSKAPVQEQLSEVSGELMPMWTVETIDEVAESVAVVEQPQANMAMPTIEYFVEESEPVAPVVAEATTPAFQWSWPLALAMLWVAGVLFMLVRLAVSTFNVWRIIRRGTLVANNGRVRIVTVDSPISAFSWMNVIVMSADDYASEARGMILAHEMAHVRLGHSADLLLVDLLSSVQWFNPVVYLLRGALQDVHEYQADNVVLEHGFDAKSYQYMILAEAVAVNGYYVTNNLNIRSLKNRITMMNRADSPFLKAFKVVYAPALVLMYLSATAVTVYDGKPELGNFTLEGYVTPGLRDVAYLVSISDENLSEVAETRKIEINDRKFTFTTNYNEPRLAKIQAIFENGENAGGIIPLLIVPDEQAHLKVKNGTYELTGESGFYQQYGYACDLIKNANLNGFNDRMPVIVKYFKEHLSEEGCVMAYLNSQAIPTQAILANMDSTVRNGRLRNVFDNQMYGVGFSKSDCQIPASVSGETSLDNLSIPMFNDPTMWKSIQEIKATDDFGIVSYQVKSWPLSYVYEENQAYPMDWLAKPNQQYLFRSTGGFEPTLTLLVAQSDTVNENIRRIPVIWMTDDSCHVEIGKNYYEITGKSPFYNQYADAVKYGKSVAGKKDATKKLTDYLKKNSDSQGAVMAFIANGFLSGDQISAIADNSVKNGYFKKLFDEGYLDKGFTSEALLQKEAEKEKNKNLQVLSIYAKNEFKGCSYKLHTYSLNAIYDDANSAPASSINMFGNNSSYVERCFLPTGLQLKVLVAQSDDVNENIARIPIIWMPNDSCHVEIGNDYYEITGNSPFYKQYADAVNFANSVAGKKDATELLTAYFVKNASSDGAVMAFIANGYLPANTIELMASKYVKKGKFKALFEGGYLSKGFLQESEANDNANAIK